MNGHDLQFLADRADTVRGRPDQRLGEVHARIRSARRRRAAAAGAGASAAVVALVIGVAVLTGTSWTEKDNSPIPPVDSPSRTDAPTTATAGTAATGATARQVTYADGGPIRTIHVGDRIVDISDLVAGRSDPPVYLNTTDDGVVVTVDDDESRIWFTDGTDVVAIGRGGGYTHIGPSPVATGTSGSLAAWLDRSGGSTELVVYDTAQLSEVTRLDCPECSSLTVVGSHVYWDEQATGPDEPTTMYDAASDAVRRASQQAYLDDLATLPRGLLVGDTRTTATPTSGIGLSLTPVNGHLVSLLDHGEDPAHEVTTQAFDTGSGDQLDLRLPPGYRSSQMLNVFDWLDDDRLALVADGDQGTDQGQILVCRISSQSCRLMLPSSSSHRWVANGSFP